MSSVQQDERLLAAAVQASADAIFCTDSAGRLTTWNPAAEALYGYPADDVLGREAGLLLPERSAEQMTAGREAALAGQPGARFDSWHQHRDGRMLAVSVALAPLRSAAGDVIGVATTVSDIRERLQLAIELEDARVELQRHNAALQRSNRDLEQFAYVASHDLSEPLRVMTGYVTQLERKYEDLLDERGRRYMHHIVDASKRMRALIDDLLDYSRFLRAARETAAVDTRAVVDQVLRSLAAPLRESGAEVEVGPLPMVWSDPKQLESLVQNLLSNAVKFTAEGSRPKVELSASQADGWVTLVVDDNGIGIAPEYRERVFRMFHRLHVREDYAGTGIGLAIAQQIVELHDGRIWVEDSPLGGARFCCTLPGVAAGEETRG